MNNDAPDAGSATPRGVPARIWISFLVVAAGVAGLWLATRSLDRKVSGAARVPFGQVRDFRLTNQLGAEVTLASLRGRPWVGNVIFTRCPGPCASLTRLMSQVQAELADLPEVRLVSLTSDPEFDTPGVLAEYGRKFQADPERWWFLTGAAAEVRRVAVQDLLLVVVEKEEEERVVPEDLFIHSTLLVVVDGEGRLRASVEGLEPGARDKVVAAVRELAQEGGRR
ncbi:MAG TPA: SCO family protein [Verrucomicrobiota bacterium]|nr:SCO family protein [Verrucomicrobiota bacterium]